MAQETNMKENIVSQFFSWLKFKRAMRDYKKEVEIEKEEELAEAVRDTTNSMKVLREALIELYAHNNRSNGKVTISRIRN